MHEIDRVLGILLELQSGRGVSAKQLAARFVVSTRTIYRDVQTMSLLGIPIYSKRGRNGGIRLLEGYFLPPLMFSREEAIALLLALLLLRSLRVVPFQAQTETAAQKLLAAVPGHLRTLLARLERVIGVERTQSDIFHPEPDETVGTEHPQRESEVVTRFVQALLEQRTVRMRYQSPYRETATESVADPLGLFWDRDRWYLVGAILGSRGAHVTWRADRATDLAVLGPKDGTREKETDRNTGTEFDIAAMLRHAWLKSAMDAWRQHAPVLLRITGEQARRLSQDWYYRYASYEAEPDGTRIMTFGEDHPEVVLALVRWLGPGATLLAPEAWRARLHRELEAMLGET